MTCLCQMFHMRLRIVISSSWWGGGVGGVKMVIMELVHQLEKIIDDENTHFLNLRKSLLTMV